MSHIELTLKAELKGHVAKVRELRHAKLVCRSRKDHEDAQAIALIKTNEKRDGRTIHIARGFLSGTPYRLMEKKTSLNEWEVKVLAREVASRVLVTDSRILEWMNE